MVEEFGWPGGFLARMRRVAPRSAGVDRRGLQDGRDGDRRQRDSRTIATTGMLLKVRPSVPHSQRRETAMEWLWVLFMVLMGAIPIALVILAVVLIPRRRKSENADSHVEWWTPPQH